MPYTITGKNSVYTSGVAFLPLVGNDKLTINADGYLLSTNDTAAALAGNWTITVNGVVGAFVNGMAERSGIWLASQDLTKASTITIGTTGDVFGEQAAIFAEHITNITNRGALFASEGSGILMSTDIEGNYKITNSGHITGAGASGTGISTTGDGVHTISNTGSITGSLNSISSQEFGVEIVTNSGKLFGTVYLGAQNDTFTNSGTVTGDVLLGDGDDTFTNTGTVTSLIDMGEGNDKFTGGSKTDSVIDDEGADKYSLGGGNDIYVAVVPGTGSGNDIVDGGAGDDLYNCGPAATQLIINLDTIAQAEILGGVPFGVGADAKTAKSTMLGGEDIGKDTITGFERVEGGSQSDVIFGNASANMLSGNDGGDRLWGLGGNDQLFGGGGGDLLVGGLGRDTHVGGGGNDTFAFGSIKESGVGATLRDRIVDFIPGDDKIRLIEIDANTKVTGDQAFDLIDTDAGHGAFTKVAGQLRYFYTNGNTVIEGDVNGDARADFQIELPGHYSLLTDSDFLL